VTKITFHSTVLSLITKLIKFLKKTNIIFDFDNLFFKIVFKTFKFQNQNYYYIRGCSLKENIRTVIFVIILISLIKNIPVDLLPAKSVKS